VETVISKRRPVENKDVSAAKRPPEKLVERVEAAHTVESETVSVPRRPVWESSEFGAIYEAHSQCIYYLALRLMGDPTQAEDATHDVFLKAYRKMDQFRGESGVRTWLYRITINHCQNLVQTWHQRHIINNADDSIWETTSSGIGDNPLRLLETKELGQRIQKTLETLSEEYRLLLLLVADEKLSYQEIGVLTDQTADAVRGKLHRARKAFAAAFGKLA
jgi:RNA polymerase sigma-70 factor (ECF subfamily)